MHRHQGLPHTGMRHAEGLVSSSMSLVSMMVGSIKQNVPHPTSRKKQEHSAVTGVCHCPLDPMLGSIDEGEESLIRFADQLATIRSICAYLSLGWISSDVYFSGLLDRFGCDDTDPYGFYDYEHDCACNAICSSYPGDQLMRHVHKLCLSQEKRLDIKRRLH